MSKRARQRGDKWDELEMIFAAPQLPEFDEPEESPASGEQEEQAEDGQQEPQQ
jgi:hypothetical protein